ncbi:MAG TPA: hypothetical protein VGG35_09855 [Streptosporangiaceae bacterium]|jgi:hypothetical protein
MDADRETAFADKLAEVGRRVGQTMDDARARLQPTLDAVNEAASRPEVRAVIDRAEKIMRLRPCLCWCPRAHPEDRGICEVLDAVITGHLSSAALGEMDVPICAPCAAARAAREFDGGRSERAS